MLLWCDGFDHYGGNIARMLEGAYAEATSINTTVVTTNPRTGTHHLRFPGGFGLVRRTLGADKEIVGLGFSLYLSALPNVNGRLALAQPRDNANDAQCSLTVTTTGQIELRNGDSFGAVLATSGQVLTAGAYHHIEARLRVHDSAGACEVRVNGVTVLDAADVDTQATANADAAQVALGHVGGTLNIVTDIDDLFCWDTAGAQNNDFLGDHRVRLLLPDQDTAQADWAVTGAATGFDAINDATPDDDTSYIAADAADDVSEFGLADLPGEVSAIAALLTAGRMRKTDAGDCNVQVSLVSAAVGSPPAPAVADGADRPITEAYTYWHDVFEADPATGAPWTRAAVNAALLRVARTV